MGLFDIFKWKQYKEEAEEYEEEVDELQEELEDLQEKYDDVVKQLNPDQQALIKIREELSRTHYEKAGLESKLKGKNDEIERAEKKIHEKEKQLKDVENRIKEKEKYLITMDDDILVQDFGLYQPRYDFMSSQLYKDKLKNIRDQQKQLIKDDAAVTGASTWTVNNSAKEGKKMVNDMKKLFLRAFNSDCDDLTNKVTYLNIDASKTKLTKSCDAISKLGKIMQITISQNYVNLKIEELIVAFEYAQKKQEEKEEQKEIKARMREEAKLQKEIDDAMKKVKKEEQHYATALTKVKEQLKNATEEQKEALIEKQKELEESLGEIEKNLTDIDYRQANARAGYVYIISNIGSFGENVYKIGMTRRLEPMDRVDELGDASVPFNFDVHAMIFSDDAPKLENALHKAFENKKVNMVNHRREFFNVTLGDIEKVVTKNYDKTVEFTKIAEATQYRQSLEMKKNLVSS